MRVCVCVWVCGVWCVCESVTIFGSNETLVGFGKASWRACCGVIGVRPHCYPEKRCGVANVALRTTETLVRLFVRGVGGTSVDGVIGPTGVSRSTACSSACTAACSFYVCACGERPILCRGACH